MPRIASSEPASRAQLLTFLRPRHRAILLTRRADAGPQVSMIFLSDDWDDYRAAMLRQAKVLLRVAIDRWGPIATGGFAPELAG